MLSWSMRQNHNFVWLFLKRPLKIMSISLQFESTWS